MKVLAIRLSCVCVFMSLFVGISPVWSWDASPQKPQVQNNDDDDDDEYADDQEASREVNPSDSGDDSPQDGGANREAESAEKKTTADGGPSAAPLRKGPLRKVPPPAVAPGRVPPPAAVPPGDKLPTARVPAPGKMPAMRRPVAGVPPTAVVAQPPTPKAMGERGKAVVGKLVVDTTLKQDSMVWELRLLWIFCALFAFSFVLLFLHFLIPVGGLKFLSKGSHLFLILGNIGLGAVLIYRLFYLGQWPGTTMQSSLLWFGFTGLSAYTWQRRRYPDVYIGSGVLLVIVTCAVGWVIAGKYTVPLFTVSSLYTSSWWLSSNLATYTAFGFLAAAGSWMISSMFLGSLAKRNRGTGCGLKPSRWGDYRLFPSFLVFVAYPLLTLAWIGQMLWSQQYLGDVTQVWATHPRLWSVPFVWLLLTAHLFALRAPKPPKPLDEFDDEFDDEFKPVSSKPRKLPGFLLFLATVGGSLLFVGIHFYLAYLRTS